MDWTVRGMDEATRRRAEAAADAAGLTLAAWLDRTILDNAASHVPPAWTPRAEATADDDLDDETDSLADPDAQAQIQQALDALDARLERTGRNIAGAVIPISRKIDAIADRVETNSATALVPVPSFVIPPNRAYRRGLGLIAAGLLLLSVAGAGGLVWLWFEMHKPPPNPYAEADPSQWRQTLSPAAREAMRATDKPPAAADATSKQAATAPSDAPSEYAELDRLIARSREGNLAADQPDAPQTGEADKAPAVLAQATTLSGTTDGDAKLLAELRASAAKNDAKAQHDLGLLLMEGRLLPRDEKAAAEMFEKAAMQGLANAQYNIGVIYDNGIGRSADPALAYFWYSAAADQGHVPAQYNLGVAAAQGKGAPRDYAIAALWFERAARSGLPDAQYNLGQMYESGIGLPRDLEKAYDLYRSAAAQGFTPARQRMIGLTGQVATRPDLPPVAPQSTSSSTPRNANSPLPAASLGRQEIVEIQTLLRKLELLKSNADGMLGPGTRAAIRQYQALAGLPASGEPSRDLLEELREVAK